MSAGLENLDQQPKDSDKVQQSVEGAGAADDFEKTKPGKGAITSDYYRTFNIPERFDNPGLQRKETKPYVHDKCDGLWEPSSYRAHYADKFSCKSPEI